VDQSHAGRSRGSHSEWIKATRSPLSRNDGRAFCCFLLLLPLLLFSSWPNSTPSSSTPPRESGSVPNSALLSADPLDLLQRLDVERVHHPTGSFGRDEIVNVNQGNRNSLHFDDR
jgi:hypothetical protein